MKFISFVLTFTLITSCFLSCTKDINSSFYSHYSIEDSVGLQFTPNSVVSFINNVLVNGNKYYIIQPKRIFLYNAQGTFLKKLSKFGSGPNEYSEITWADININKEVIIYDGISNNILVYDSLLTFKKKYFINTKYNNYLMFIISKNNHYYFYNKNIFVDKFTINEFDTNLNHKNSYSLFPYNSAIEYRIAGNRNLAYAFDKNQLIISHIFDPKIKILDIHLKQELPPILLHNNFWTSINKNKVKRLLPNEGANPKNIYHYLRGKVKIWKIFYTGNGNILIEYWLPHKKFVLQLFNLNTKSALHTVIIPDKLGEINAIHGHHIFFVRYHPENPNLNPTILIFTQKTL